MTSMHLASRSDLIEQIERTFTREAVALTCACTDQAERSGTALYLVGGALRDLLRGPSAPMCEIDLAVQGEVEAIARAAARASNAEFTLFPRFRTAHLRLGSATVDLASARRERYPEPTAPPVVWPAAIADDLPRRDFSVNAMALALTNERRGELLDPCGGLCDLRARRIRVLHTRSFIHDPARLLRACRYAARLEGCLSRETMRLLRRDANGLQWLIPRTLRSRVASAPRGQGSRRRAAASGGMGTNRGSSAGLATDITPAACLGATGRQGKTAERALLGTAGPNGRANPDTAPSHALLAATQGAASVGTWSALATAPFTDHDAFARSQRSGSILQERAGVGGGGCCGPMDGVRGGARAAVSIGVVRNRVTAKCRGACGTGSVQYHARHLARGSPRRRARRGTLAEGQWTEQKASRTKVGAAKSSTAGRIESAVHRSENDDQHERALPRMRRGS